MQKFCHNCGKQLVVGAKFCPECGTSLSSLSNKPPTPPSTKPDQGQFAPFAVGRDDEDDDSYLDKMTHVDVRQNELHVEIVKDRPLGESIGNLITQALAAGKPPELDPARHTQPVDSKAFLAEFQREAGTLKRDEKQ